MKVVFLTVDKLSDPTPKYEKLTYFTVSSLTKHVTNNHIKQTITHTYDFCVQFERTFIQSDYSALILFTSLRLALSR